MKQTKRRIEWFSFYDHTGIERHLARMAERGWLLEKFGGFTWHYRRIEPKRLTFSVSYFPKASVFDPEPSEEQETFYDFCAHTGWTLAAASAQMQVFYNERPDPVPIDTDPALEVDAVHRSAKKSFLPPQILLLAVGALNFGQFLWHLFDDPVATLSSPLHLFSLVCWPVVLLMIGTELGAYFLWRGRARKAAGRGEFLATRSRPAVQAAGLAVVTAGLVWCLAYLRGWMLSVMVVMLVCMFGIVALVLRLREWLKGKKVPAGVNRAATLGACVALPLVVVALVMALILSSPGRERRDPGELPLTLADLTGRQPAGGDSVDYRDFSQSPLLSRLTVNQQLGPEETGGGGFRGINYGVVRVKLPALYNVCKDSLLRQYDRYDGYYVPTDPAPWGAVEAYQSAYAGGGPVDGYLLCYPGRIVEIGFDWEPTPEQMALVGERLGG